MERYLRVNLLGPGRPASYEKSIYQAAVSQRLRNSGLKDMTAEFLKEVGWFLFNASTYETYSHVC